MHALLYFKLLPEQQHDHLGCVAYSANRGIKVHDLGVNTSILIDCGGVDLPRCLAHDPEGRPALGCSGVAAAGRQRHCGDRR